VKTAAARAARQRQGVAGDRRQKVQARGTPRGGTARQAGSARGA